MFNVFKTEMVLRMALERAEEELNVALRHRQRQFNCPQAYFALRRGAEGCRIVLHDPVKSVDLVDLDLEGLLALPELQAQLGKVPKFLQSQIKWPQIMQHIELKSGKLGADEELQACGAEARAEIWRSGPQGRERSSLLKFFGS